MSVGVDVVITVSKFDIRTCTMPLHSHPSAMFTGRAMANRKAFETLGQFRAEDRGPLSSKLLVQRQRFLACGDRSVVPPQTVEQARKVVEGFGEVIVNRGGAFFRQLSPEGHCFLAKLQVAAHPLDVRGC